jgi:tetratricopeptide (TPR) repeat protein
MRETIVSEIDLAAKFNIPTPTQLDLKAPVLVVDDQQDLRLIIAHHLGKLQFAKVIQAANGLEALEAIRNNPNLAAVICDSDMPGMTGMELIAEIRENVGAVRVPFCIAMDHVSKEKIMLAVESGTDEILVKPFTLADIVPKIRSAFKIFHNPKNPERIYELAKTALRDKDLTKAELIYSDLYKSAPKTARPLVGLARIEIERGHTEKALKYLQDAEKNNPNYVHVFSVRGELYAHSGDIENALACYRQGITLSPLNPLRYVSAVALLSKVEKYQEITELLSDAVEREIAFPDLYHYLSQAHYNLRDFKKAIKYIKSALSTDPENVNYLNQLAISYKESDQFEEATKAYNQIIKKDPNNLPALFNKSIMFAHKGQIDEAIKIMERAVLKHPDFAKAKVKLKEMQTQKQGKGAA